MSTDAAATLVISPRTGTVMLAGATFAPDGLIENAGTTTASDLDALSWSPGHGGLSFGPARAAAKVVAGEGPGEAEKNRACTLGTNGLTVR